MPAGVSVGVQESMHMCLSLSDILYAQVHAHMPSNINSVCAYVKINEDSALTNFPGSKFSEPLGGAHPSSKDKLHVHLNSCMSDLQYV